MWSGAFVDTVMFCPLLLRMMLVMSETGIAMTVSADAGADADASPEPESEPEPETLPGRSPAGSALRYVTTGTLSPSTST